MLMPELLLLLLLRHFCCVIEYMKIINVDLASHSPSPYTKESLKAYIKVQRPGLASQLGTLVTLG